MSNKDKKEMNKMDCLELKNKLETEFIGRQCIYFDEIDSTNDEAKRQADKGACDGFLVFSDSQSAGRGRLGRQWWSEKGVSIYFSIVLRPPILLTAAPMLTLVAGIGVMNSLRKKTGLDFKIKWPNDIVINDKKACGILTEMRADNDRIGYVVVGIGININNTVFDDEIAYKATSVFLESGSSFDRMDILCSCLKEFEDYYKEYIKSGFKALKAEYRNNCANIGKEVRLCYSGEELEGSAVDISDNGEIVIEKKNGERISVFGGEVSLRRADGGYI